MSLGNQRKNKTKQQEEKMRRKGLGARGTSGGLGWSSPSTLISGGQERSPEVTQEGHHAKKSTPYLLRGDFR
jgi:hypothetical protein